MESVTLAEGLRPPMLENRHSHTAMIAYFQLTSLEMRAV